MKIEEEALKHPYDEKNFLRLFEEGWETLRLASKSGSLARQVE